MNSQILKFEVCRVDKDGVLLVGEGNKAIVFGSFEVTIENSKPLSQIRGLVDKLMKKHFIVPIAKDDTIVVLPKALNDKAVVIVVSFDGVQIEVIKSDVFRAANNTVKNTDKLCFAAINFGVLISDIAASVATCKGVSIELLNAIVTANTEHKDAKKVSVLSEATKIGLLSSNKKKLNSIKTVVRKEIKEHSGLTTFRKDLKAGSANGVKFISDSAKF